jgi:hypothetical protein
MEKEPNPKIFYVYGGAILVFKGNFFQHLNQNICPPVPKIHQKPAYGSRMVANQFRADRVIIVTLTLDGGYSFIHFQLCSIIEWKYSARYMRY